MVSWVVYVCLALGLSSALVGGVFLSFSDFVMQGLLRAAPAGGIESMQQLNRTVYRSVFVATLVALAPASAALSVYAGLELAGPARALIIGATVCYLLCVVAVTAAGNIPMNERLDAMAPDSPEAERYWVTYGRVWTRYNHVRTLGAGVAALGFHLAAISLAAS